MLEIAFKVVLTCVLGFFIYYVWTIEIDVRRTITKPLTSMLTIRKSAKLEVSAEQMVMGRFRSAGEKTASKVALVMYQLHLINSSNEALTLREVKLRVTTQKGMQEIAPVTLTTGSVKAPKGQLEDAAIMQANNKDGGVSRMILIGWKNLSSILAEYRTLGEGAVLAGSAAFVLDMKDPAEVAQLKSLKLIAIDFSGNEIAIDITIDPKWLEQARKFELVNQSFYSDGEQGFKWR